VEYFKRILGGVGRRMIRRMRGDRKDDEEEEITRGEVKEVKRLREEKAIGGVIRGSVEVRGGEAGRVRMGNE